MCGVNSAVERGNSAAEWRWRQFCAHGYTRWRVCVLVEWGAQEKVSKKLPEDRDPSHSHLLPLLDSITTVLAATSTAAFAPAGSSGRTSFLTASTLPGAEVDNVGNNVAFKELLEEVQERQLLSQVAQSGLLSKAQEAGVSLSKLEPLLKLASDNPDILVLVEASGPELLPILPAVVRLAPPALPLLAAAISIPPTLLQVAGLGSLGLAVTILQVVPDDTVAQVALQTLAVGVFGIAAPVASFAGAAVLGQLTK